jgi:spore maturation protein CgeB
MKIVIFGLTISSSWGNGHATLWRGLCKALTHMGHKIEFFERDVPYYAAHRDLQDQAYGDLVLYEDWDAVRWQAARSMREADAIFVTSYCPDACAASELAHETARGLRVFYDLDTPVTLARLEAGEMVDYVGACGLRDFDLVLSFTGGGALDALRERLGAPQAEALYGHVDPDVHRRVPAQERYAGALSYLGTYADDRQTALEELLVKPARGCPSAKFVIGGAQYPASFPWSPNIYFVRHLPPSEHAAFFSSSRLTLNITRRSMAAMGWCPSGRLFEAAACGTALISDPWDGLDAFFRPGAEILIAQEEGDVRAFLDLSDVEIERLGAAACDRVLTQHTSAHRAQELCALLERAARTAPLPELMEA